MRMTKTMKLYTIYLIVALVVLVSCSAIPKPGEKDNKRVHDQKLSDIDHHLDDDDEEHDEDYDHEAFLGKDDAKSFDDLTPEESRDRLGLIVDKIDKDHDGQVTGVELKDWIHYVQKKYIMTDTERMWKDHDVQDDKLTFVSYQKRTFGFDAEDEANENHKEMIERDRRRWEAADVNKDGHLTKDEFADFLHPEDATHMQDVVVEETMEDIDKDGDGFISLEEYISDVYDEDDDEDDEHEEAPHDGEPDWVRNEREQFKSHRDKNFDGKLDKKEVKEWIIPEDVDHSEEEAKHLIRGSDLNKDGVLSKDEILDHQDLFVGSQATDFGEALTRHDEF